MPLLFLALLVSCGQRVEPSPPSGPPLPVDRLRATWPLRAALDERVDPSLLSSVARRWLGGSGGWSAPGDPPGGAPPALTARWLEEDARAIGIIAAVAEHAACRLAQAPGALDGEVRAGYSIGARSCVALGDQEGAARARQNALASGGVEAPAATSGEGFSPAIRALRAQVEGQELVYEFIEPAEFDRAIARLRAAAAALPSAPSGPDQDVGHFFATRAGTSALLPEGEEPLLPSASDLYEGLAPGGSRLAGAEVALDKVLRRWTASLARLPAESDGGLDASGRALLNGWVRKAWQRELGLRALEAGEPDIALVLLENATGNEARLTPGAGLDPLLLAALGRARYESNELQRAVALLDDIGGVPGWESARSAARTIARLAVLPTAAEAQVKR